MKLHRPARRRTAKGKRLTPEAYHRATASAPLTATIVIKDAQGWRVTHPYGPLDHTAAATCWCQPFVEYEDPETENRVYVHKEQQA